jgi:hypothetical protein
MYSSNENIIYRSYEDYLHEMDERHLIIFLSRAKNSGGKHMSIECSCVFIPELNIFAKNVYTGSTTRRSERLFGYWASYDLNFLKYNPKIWLFRYKNYKKEVADDFYVSHKKYTHAPHLNGVNYENKRYYGGSIYCLATGITSTGVHSEFVLNTNVNTQFEIPIDPYDWFYMKGSPSYKLSDELSLSAIGYEMRVLGRPKDNLSFPFRLAVVIDDPRGGEQKLVGGMSDIIFLRVQNNKFVFRRNSSDLSIKRFNT